MSTSTLDRLLDDDLATDPVTDAGLTNHRPMALIALAAIGADDARLESFSSAYGSRLLPCSARFAASHARLLAEMERDGIEAVLDRDLAALVAGLGGAAFHGLIRLGYGIEHGRAADVAGGLAYLTDVTQPVSSGIGTSNPACDLPELLDRLRGDPSLGRRAFNSVGFSARFAEVASDTRFAEHLSALSADSCNLASLASTTLRLYRATGDFFALHTVTATHAARLVVGSLGDEGPAVGLVQGLCGAVAAAYVVIGTPDVTNLPALPQEPIPDWAHIGRAALGSDDPHVLKMVHTCRQEQAAWGGLDYQVAAAEISGSVHP